jgi:hypothetical protein
MYSRYVGRDEIQGLTVEHLELVSDKLCGPHLVFQRNFILRGEFNKRFTAESIYNGYTGEVVHLRSRLGSPQTLLRWLGT